MPNIENRSVPTDYVKPTEQSESNNYLFGNEEDKRLLKGFTCGAFNYVDRIVDAVNRISTEQNRRVSVAEFGIGNPNGTTFVFKYPRAQVVPSDMGDPQNFYEKTEKAVNSQIGLYFGVDQPGVSDEIRETIREYGLPFKSKIRGAQLKEEDITNIVPKSKDGTPKKFDIIAARLLFPHIPTHLYEQLIDGMMNVLADEGEIIISNFAITPWLTQKDNEEDTMRYDQRPANKGFLNYLDAMNTLLKTQFCDNDIAPALAPMLAEKGCTVEVIRSKILVTGELLGSHVEAMLKNIGLLAQVLNRPEDECRAELESFIIKDQMYQAALKNGTLDPALDDGYFGYVVEDTIIARKN